MKAATRVLLFGVVGLLGARPLAHAKKPRAIGWGYLHAGTVEVHAGRGGKGRVVARLGRGSVAEVFETRAGSCRVEAVSLADLTSVVGWVDCAGVETLALDRLPNDDALLAEVGGPYLEDTVKPHIVIARFLVGAGGAAPTLVCFLASPFLPQARLQLFEPVERQSAPADRYRAGGFLEFSSSQQESPITAAEVRDLHGDGNECLVTHEPVNLGRGETGVNLVIRRIERGEAGGASQTGKPAAAGKLEKLWEAALELRKLASYPPRVEVLQPPERNIGAPGTVTKGEVSFRPLGRVAVPVWTGTVEFHVLGREKPIQTIRFEKVCPWTGIQFTPLR